MHSTHFHYKWIAKINENYDCKSSSQPTTLWWIIFDLKSHSYFPCSAVSFSARLPAQANARTQQRVMSFNISSSSQYAQPLKSQRISQPPQAHIVWFEAPSISEISRELVSLVLEWGDDEAYSNLRPATSIITGATHRLQACRGRCCLCKLQ